MKNRTKLHTIALCMGASVCLADMAIKVDEQAQRYTIEENGQPLLTYNFGSVPVPAALKGKKYADPRSGYVHPLYGPNGEILTADYPSDHPHHRGIYWAWPEVTYQGEMRDIHALQGVFARPVKILKQTADKNSAVLTAENVWKWGDTEEIVREFVTITAYPRKDGIRPIDFSFTFEALRPGITLARRKQTGYGGFNFRMAQFTEVKIVQHSDAPGTYPCRSWAELTGTPPEGKETVGIFLLQNSANPLYPGDWQAYANLPWLQPTFPSAGMACELKPGEPLKLAFRVIVRDGQGLKTPPEKLFDDYAAPQPDPLLKMTSYQFGENREILTGTEQALRTADAEGRKIIEQRTLAALTSGDTSADFQSWAFRQLQLCGSAACLPAAAAHLTGDCWMQALDAIIAVPGEPGARAMLQALPALPDERRAAVILALGVRRDAAAVPVLAVYAAGDEVRTAGAALDALARIGTPEAAAVLNSVTVVPALCAKRVDARLACADALANAADAETIYRAVWSDTALNPAQRAAALIGLTRRSRVLLPEIVPALKSREERIAGGAAAALSVLDSRTLAGLQQEFDALPDPSKIIVLALWGQKSVGQAEAAIVKALESANPEIRIAAVRALRTTGGRTSVAPLLETVAAGGSPGAEAKIALAQLSGDGVFEALALAAKSQNAKNAVAAVDALSERRDPGFIDLMMTAAASSDAKTAAAALSTLRNSGTAQELPGLRKILIEGDEGVKAAAAAAIAGICGREDGTAIAAVIKATPEITGTARNAMLAALPALGGTAALAFVGTTRDEPAIRALLNWPDSSAVEPMRSIVADKALDVRLNRLASAGLLRLVQNTLPVTEQSGALNAALPDIRDDAVRAQIADYITELSTVNIAKGKPVTSSHPHQGGATPALALDGNMQSYWSCAHSPSWIKVDLGAEETLSKIRVVNYFADKRYYQYRVEISADDSTWHTVGDMSANTEAATEQGNIFKLDVLKARYVRVTMLRNSANPGMHIVELEVYGGGE